MVQWLLTGGPLQAKAAGYAFTSLRLMLLLTFITRVILVWMHRQVPSGFG